MTFGVRLLGSDVRAEADGRRGIRPPCFRDALCTVGRRGEGDMVPGRVLVRFLVVLTLVTGMMLAPVVTWPGSGSTPADPSIRPVVHLDGHAPR
jgi:hypothetical protein